MGGGRGGTGASDHWLEGIWHTVATKRTINMNYIGYGTSLGSPRGDVQGDADVTFEGLPFLGYLFLATFS